MNIDIRKNRFVNFNNYYKDTKHSNVNLYGDYINLDKIKDKDRNVIHLYVLIYGYDYIKLSTIVYEDLDQKFDINNIEQYLYYLKNEILENKIKKPSDFLKHGFQFLQISNNILRANKSNVKIFNNFKENFIDKKIRFYINIEAKISNLSKNHDRHYLDCTKIHYSISIHKEKRYLDYSVYDDKNGDIIIFSKEKWINHYNKKNYERKIKLKKLNEY